MTETLCRQDWLGLLEAEVERLRGLLTHAENRLESAKAIDRGEVMLVPPVLAAVTITVTISGPKEDTQDKRWRVDGHKFTSLQRAEDWVKERQTVAEIAAVMVEKRETC